MKITIPAGPLATAWLNCFQTTGTDENRPALYRTVLVEVFDRGVQLVATDTFMLLGGFAPTEAGEFEPPPSIDEAPVASFVVMDRNKRGQQLMKYIADEAREAEEDDRALDVTLTAASVEELATPTLDPSLDRVMFTIATDTESVRLPIYDADYSNWRAMLDRHQAAKAERVAFSPQLLGRFGKLRAPGGPVVLNFSGPSGLVLLSAPSSETYLFGAVVASSEGP